MKKILIAFLAVLLLLPLSGRPEEPSAAEPVSVPGDISIRDYADLLQDTFGVTILAGEECAGAADPASFAIGSGAAMQNAAAGLREIEIALCRYKKEFFGILKDKNHPNGLRILLTDRITVRNPELHITCYTDDGAGWYNIYLENGNFDQSSVHHDIWHVLEKAIRAEYRYAFSDWILLNPADFVYPYDYSADIGEYNENYFARGYGTISQEEDRATIFEAVFNDNFEEWIAEKTGIKYKLYYMNTFMDLLMEDAGAE